MKLYALMHCNMCERSTVGNVLNTHHNSTSRPTAGAVLGTHGSPIAHVGSSLIVVTERAGPNLFDLIHKGAPAPALAPAIVPWVAVLVVHSPHGHSSFHAFPLNVISGSSTCTLHGSGSERPQAVERAGAPAGPTGMQHVVDFVLSKLRCCGASLEPHRQEPACLHDIPTCSRYINLLACSMY